MACNIKSERFRRMNRRPEAARTLVGVVADVLPASQVLRPSFVARLLL